MATRLKPSRINVDNDPRVWDGAAYQNDNDFHWSEWGGDMSYEDFEWVTLTWNSLVIENISNNVTPTGNFTVTAGTLRPGIEYVLRVNTGNTPYTMTLGTGVTNPNGYSTELTPNRVNQFKFIATSDSQLELEGVDTSEYLTWLTILSYGNSTWNDFITAYQKNSIVYCRASSNSNPATWAQNRLAFMAYVNNATSPTEVEFQYYRSRSSHGSDDNQQDEVYVYKLTSSWTWTVEIRDTAAKIATWTWLTKAYTTSWTRSTLTIVNDGVLTVNGANGTVIVNDIKQSATAPANPTAWTAWYDTTNWALKVYNWSAWDTIATWGSISDTAYGSGWDGQTTTAPSQNAVYDKISAMDTTISWKQDTLVSWTNIKTVNNNSLLGSWNLTLNDVKVSSTAPSSPTEWMVWYDTTNDQLKVYDWTNWNVTGKEYNAWPWISIGQYQDYSAMRWPCPEGFHVPTWNEMSTLVDIMKAFSLQLADYYIQYLFFSNYWWRWANWTTNITIGSWMYWCCTEYSNTNANYIIITKNNNVNSVGNLGKRIWMFIRPFKNTLVIPDNTWTTIFDGSSVAAWAWIFHNTTLWLISLSSDWTNWITISDKNAWASQIFQEWDTTISSNWYMYQWWNNYWFPITWDVTASTTTVDASNYWPGNYYSSSTFINVSPWSSPNNANLRWATTWVVTLNDAITNTGVLSVNGETGDVTILPGWESYWEWSDIFIEWGELPSWYTQLEYAQSDGTFGINTWWLYDWTSELKLEARFMGTAYNWGWAAPFWLQNVWYSNWIYPFYWENSTAFTYWWNLVRWQEWYYHLNRIYTIRFATEWSTFYREVNSIDDVVGTYDKTAVSTTSPLFIFSWWVWTTATNAFAWRIYSLRIWKWWVLDMNLIPAKRNSDNAIWMYDVVWNNFFTNAALVAWPTVTDAYSISAMGVIVDDWTSTVSRNPVMNNVITNYVNTSVSWKQDTLVSWTNIKTVNSNSLLGSGNISLNEVPSGWNNGDVLTNVSWTPTWSAPSWWAEIIPKTSYLAASLWKSNTQTINVTWVTDSNIVLVSPTPDSANDYFNNSIRCSRQWNGTLIFTCNTIPENIVMINILIINV